MLAHAAWVGDQDVLHVHLVRSEITRAGGTWGDSAVCAVDVLPPPPVPSTALA